MIIAEKKAKKWHAFRKRAHLSRNLKEWHFVSVCADCTAGRRRAGAHSAGASGEPLASQTRRCSGRRARRPTAFRSCTTRKPAMSSGCSTSERRPRSSAVSPAFRSLWQCDGWKRHPVQAAVPGAVFSKAYFLEDHGCRRYPRRRCRAPVRFTPCNGRAAVFHGSSSYLKPHFMIS